MVLARDTCATASHCASRHEDPAWRSAGREVADACRKYLQHLAGSRSLYRRLQQHRRPRRQSPSGDGVATGGVSANGLHERLVDSLLDWLDQQGGLVEDGLTTLLALEAGDPLQATLRSAVAAEERLLAALDAAISDPDQAPVVAMHISLDDPDVLRPYILTAAQHRSPRTGSSGCSACDAASNTSSSIAADAEAAAAAARPAAAAGDPGGELAPVLLTRGAVVRCLEQHGDARVRRDVYVGGLLPRVQSAALLLRQLARCRATIAAAHGAPSYTQLALRPCLVSDPAAAAAALQRLAQAVRPLADAQLQALAAHWAASGAGELHAWDVDRAQVLARKARDLDVDPAQLEPHLHLGPLLRGLSSLLGSLLGVRLLPRAPTPHEAVAAAGVTPVTVMSGARVVGTVYVECGSTYGTRLLRHAQPAGAAATSGGGDSLQPPQQAVRDQQQVLEALVAADALAPGQPLPAASSAVLATAAAHLPVVAVGVGGAAGGVLAPSTLWEWLHEMGHALHLVLSSAGQRHAHLGGRYLPPDLLELPSQLFERLALHPPALAAICRHVSTAAPMPTPLAVRLSALFAARHYSPLALQDKVCAALADLALAVSCGADADCWLAARREASSVTHVLGAPATARDLGVLPVVAHSRGRYHAYLISWCCASRVWEAALLPLLSSITSSAGAASVPVDAATSPALPLVGANVVGDSNHRLLRRQLAAVMHADAACTHAQLMELVMGEGWHTPLPPLPPPGPTGQPEACAAAAWVEALVPGSAEELRGWLWLP